VAGGIAPLAEQLGDADFALSQVVSAAVGDPTPDPVAVGRAAGENRRAGRRADSTGGITLREAHSLGSKPVEVRGANERMSIAGQISPALIVGEKDHDVGPSARVCFCANRLHCREATEQEHHDATSAPVTEDCD